MNNLKSLNDQLAAIRAEQSKASAQLGDLAVEVFDLESNPGTRASRITAAEEHLIDQLARHDLGEPCDVPSAEKALADAKALPDDGFAIVARLRVLDVLRQRAEAAHQAAHERGLAVVASIKRAEIERLRELILSEREAATASMISTAKSEALLIALLAELHTRGAQGDLPPISEGAIRSNTLSTFNARAEILAALAA